MKVQFHIQCSPDEVLRVLLCEKTRLLWDHNLQEITVNSALNQLSLKYRTSDPGVLLSETIQFKYMAHQNKFYIIEEIDGEDGSNYTRVWILEQILNRPYLMRVTHISQ